MSEYLDRLTDKYYRDLTKGQPVTGGLGGGLGQLRGMEKTYSDPNSFSNRLNGAIGPMSRLGKVIDVLARPAYTVGNRLKESIVEPFNDLTHGTFDSNLGKGLKEANGDVGKTINAIFNAEVGSGYSGLGGRSKTMPSNALFDRWETDSTPEGVAKFLAGFGTDVGLDPLTYVPGAAIGGLLKQLPGAAKTIEALKGAGNLEKDAIELAPAISTPVAPVGEITAEAAKPKFDISQFNSFLGNNAKKAVEVPRTAEGQRVYNFDLRKLPTIFPMPAAKKTVQAVEDSPVLDPAAWIEANAGMKVKSTDLGELAFADAADTGATTLRELLDAANASGDAGKLQLDQISKLYRSSYADIMTHPLPGATPALEASRIAAQRASGATRRSRATGAKRAEIIQKWEKHLDPEDVDYLQKSRGIDDFNARRKAILSRAAAPFEASNILRDAPEDSAFRNLLLGETSSAPRPVGPINPSTPVVARVVDEVVKKQLDTGFKYRSGVKDAARSHPERLKGDAIADRGINARAQSEIVGRLIRHVNTTIKKDFPQLKGDARAVKMADEVMRLVDESEAVLRSRGLEPILGSSHTGIPLSFGDLLHALSKSPAGKAAMLSHIFDAKRGVVVPSNLMDAAQHLFETLKDAGITDVLEAEKFFDGLRAARGGEESTFREVGRELIKDPGGSEAAARRAANDKAPGVQKGIQKLVKEKGEFKTVEGKPTRVSPDRWVMEGLGGKELDSAARALLSGLTDRRVLRELTNRAHNNAAAFGKRLGDEVDKISEQVVNDFNETWLSPTTSTGEAIGSYKAIDSAVNLAGESIDAMSASKQVAGDLTALAVADSLGEDVSIVGLIDKVMRAAKKGDKREVVKLMQQLHNLNAAEGAEDSLANLTNVAENIGASVDHNFIRAFFPLTTKTPEGLIGRAAEIGDKTISKFVAQSGHATVRHALTQNRSVARRLANNWRERLTNIAHEFANRPDELKEIFARIQSPEGLSVEAGAAEADLQAMVKILFETSDEGVDGAGAMFMRNGFDIDHLNAKFRQMDLPEHVTYDLEKYDGTIESLVNQWRDWKIDDPIDFMARMQAAMASITGDVAIAREGFRIAASKGMASTVKRAGFKQLYDTTGKSVLNKYLPPGAWYHPDIIPELRAMDKVLQESQSLTSEFGKFVSRFLDPALNAWKAGMTIYRPGHHVRNLIGDESLSFNADGLQTIGHKYNALKIMGYARKDKYTDWDAMKALQSIPRSYASDPAAIAAGSEVVSKLTLRGKKSVDLTAAQIHRAMTDGGSLVDFVAGEDLIGKGAEKLAKEFRPFGGNVRKAAGKASESRDDFVRISHFLQILEKNSGKFNSVDEAFEFANQRVRKWHPDGTDLSTFESKVMRRIFPFYSWTKKTMPLVIETMMMHPGRILVWPKVMYNAAQASGIDVNSLGDPFPTDQLFPSFLTDMQTGPILDVGGNYYGAHPGVANDDLLNEFVGDPKEGILGMVSPFIKGPLELLAGTNFATGGKINDVGEYIEGSIPGLSQFGSVTGTSPLGTMGNALSGNVAVDPRQSMVKAAESGKPQTKIGPFNTEGLINFFTGLGLQNQSKQSYINIAEMERRDRASKEANK